MDRAVVGVVAVAAFAAVALAACGRIGFDDHGGDRDAAPPGGPRWVRVYPAVTTGAFARVSAAVPDGNGGAAAVVPFQGAVLADGAQLNSQGFGVNSLITTILPDGRTDWLHALHAGFHCDMRAVGFAPGGLVIAGGLTSGAPGGTGDPCDLGVQAPQDPLVIDYHPDGTYAATASWDATVQNAQLWQIRAYPDNARAIFGVYGGNLMINGVALPPAPACCEAAFVARVGGIAAQVWQYGFTSATSVFPNTMDLDEVTGDLCIAGYFDSTTTVLGVPLATAGGNDVWIARITAAGDPRFVRSLGSTAPDNPHGVVARADGGCTVLLDYNADLPLGGSAGTLIHQGGRDTAVVRLSADGSVVGAGTIASPANEDPGGLVATGGAVFAAVDFDGPLTIGGTTLTPQTVDAVLIQLTGDAPDTVAAVITGAGDVRVYGVAGRDGDVVVYGDYAGELRIGTFADTQTDRSAFVMAADLR